MKCYYQYDEEKQSRFLVPQCWGTVHSEDLADCICETSSFHQFENEKFKKAIQEKNKEIKEMQKLIIKLDKKVEFWHKKYLKKNDKQHHSIQ